MAIHLKYTAIHQQKHYFLSDLLVPTAYTPKATHCNQPEETTLHTFSSPTLQFQQHTHQTTHCNSSAKNQQIKFQQHTHKATHCNQPEETALHTFSSPTLQFQQHTHQTTHCNSLAVTTLQFTCKNIFYPTC
jgi:hypothetical protein